MRKFKDCSLLKTVSYFFSFVNTGFQEMEGTWSATLAALTPQQGVWWLRG